MGSGTTRYGLDKEDAVEAEQLEHVCFISFSRGLWESQSGSVCSLMCKMGIPVLREVL